MFTWICPKCGREVPPSYSECPNCAELAQRAMSGQPAPPPPYGAPQPQNLPPPPQQGYAPPPPASFQPPPQQGGYPPPPPPPQQYQSQPPQYPQQGPPQGYPPPPQGYVPPQPVHTIPDPYSAKRGMPGWLATLLVTAGLVAAGFVLYKYVLPKGGDSPVAAAKREGSDSKASTASTHPYAKFVEIAGLRFTEDRNRAKLQFVVINHSNAELSEFTLNLSVTTTAAKPDDDPLTTASVKVGSLGPWESKELSMPVTTKAKAYELPDWQFQKVIFDITGGN